MIFRKLKVLTDDEIIRIVEGAFRILAATGCRFEDAACMDELESIGCTVDRETLVAKFPEDVIFEALDSVPSMTPPDDLPKARVAAANKGFILDYPTRRMRRGTTDDAHKAVKLCNKLDNITVASAGVIQEDVPPDAVEVFNIALLMKYSEKLFTQWVYNADNVKYIFEMGKIFTGGESELRESSVLSYMLNSITPLRYPTTQLKIARMYADLDLPIAIASMTQSGSTSPATLA
ncbi:MAG TPA: trimethylamine methyltransferase family protein, partial [bacterium]|nr:trimethylamine methyltransferase family protein [bacterium]